MREFPVEIPQHRHDPMNPVASFTQKGFLVFPSCPIEFLGKSGTVSILQEASLLKNKTYYFDFFRGLLGNGLEAAVRPVRRHTTGGFRFGLEYSTTPFRRERRPCPAARGRPDSNHGRHGWIDIAIRLRLPSAESTAEPRQWREIKRPLVM